MQNSQSLSETEWLRRTFQANSDIKSLQIKYSCNEVIAKSQSIAFK